MDNQDTPHTATCVTCAEFPLCPIIPIGRKGDLMAGFLTHGLMQNITFLSSPSGIQIFNSPITVAGTVTDLKPCSLLSPRGAPSLDKL